MDKNNLVKIYRDLLGIEQAEGSQRRNVISPHQYDKFIQSWEKSQEYETILKNCVVFEKSDSEGGRKFRHYDGELPNEVRFADSLTKSRSKALAESIGEFIWMWVNNFKILPILEDFAADLPDQTTRSELPSWISMSLPTACVYHFHTHTKGGFRADFRDARLVGWVAEQNYASYSQPKSISIEDVQDIPAQLNALVRLGNSVTPKIALPAYTTLESYYHSHSSEVVVLFQPNDSGWRCQAINGLRVPEVHDSDFFVDHLQIKDPSARDAILINEIGFKPALLDILVPQNIDTKNRSPFALAITNSFKAGPSTLGLEIDTASESAATCFLLCTIEVHERQYGSMSPSGKQIDDLVRNSTGYFWDHLDLLKLPLVKQIMEATLNKQVEEAAALNKSRQLLASIFQPLKLVTDSLHQSVLAINQLQQIYGQPTRGLYARARRLADFFKNGGAEKLFGIKLTRPLDHNFQFPPGERDAELTFKAMFAKWAGKSDECISNGLEPTWQELIKDIENQDEISRDTNELFFKVFGGKERLLTGACIAFEALADDVKRTFCTVLKETDDCQLLDKDLRAALPGLPKLGQNNDPILIDKKMNPLPRISDMVETIVSILSAMNPEHGNGELIRLSSRWNSIENERVVVFTLPARTNRKDFSLSEYYKRLLSEEWRTYIDRAAEAEHGDFGSALVRLFRLSIKCIPWKLHPSLREKKGEVELLWVKGTEINSPRFVKMTLLFGEDGSSLTLQSKI